MKHIDKKSKRLTIRLKINSWKRVLNVQSEYAINSTIDSIINELIEERLDEIGY